MFSKHMVDHVLTYGNVIGPNEFMLVTFPALIVTIMATEQKYKQNWFALLLAQMGLQIGMKKQKTFANLKRHLRNNLTVCDR